MFEGSVRLFYFIFFFGGLYKDLKEVEQMDRNGESGDINWKDEMMFFFVYSYYFLYLRYYNLLCSSISFLQLVISLKLVQCYFCVFCCCVVNGGFEDLCDDGGFVVVSDIFLWVINNFEVVFI